jgi:RNA polymerase sigma-70 factor (ECF subfamily)
VKNDINIRLLIEQVKINNEAAEFKLFRLYFPYVRSICNRYSISDEEAQEMLNDTFLRIFNNIEKYDPDYEFKPWIRKICINSCLSYNKKYFQSHKSIEFDQSIYNDHIDEDSLTDQFSSDECLLMIKQLSPRYRTIFNLYVFEEMKHHEIAQQLNISVGTSKSDLSRAKAQLIGIMKKSNPDFLKIKLVKNG